MKETESHAVDGDGSPRALAAGRILSLFLAVDGCSQAVRRAVERLAGRHGLGTTQLLALWTCAEADEGIGQSELAGRVGISPAQASALVEQLRRRLLIESRRDAGDRRRQLWRVTDAGRALLVSAVDELAELSSRVETRLADVELDAMESSLERLAAAAESRAAATSRSAVAGGEGVGLRLVSPDADRGADRGDAARGDTVMKVPHAQVRRANGDGANRLSREVAR